MKISNATPLPNVHCTPPYPAIRGVDILELREAKLISLQIKKFARELRHHMTIPERIFWQQVRNRKMNGHKFRRQFPVGRFILVFYCCELKLAIELDGNQHLEENQSIYDEQRSEILLNLGIRVIRFRNIDVLNQLENVLCRIKQLTVCSTLTPTPLPKGEDAHRAGEGLSHRDNDNPMCKFREPKLRLRLAS